MYWICCSVSPTNMAEMKSYFEKHNETQTIKVKFSTLTQSISLRRVFPLRKPNSQTLKGLVSKWSSVWIIWDGIKPVTWLHARRKNPAEWFPLSSANHHHVDCCCWWGKFPEQAEAIFSKGKWVLFWIFFPYHCKLCSHLSSGLPADDHLAHSCCIPVETPAAAVQGLLLLLVNKDVYVIGYCNTSTEKSTTVASFHSSFYKWLFLSGGIDIKHTGRLKLWAWPLVCHHVESTTRGKNRNWSINIRINIATSTLMWPEKPPAWLQFQSWKITCSFTFLSLVPTKPGDVVMNNSR